MIAVPESPFPSRGARVRIHPSRRGAGTTAAERKIQPDLHRRRTGPRKIQPPDGSELRVQLHVGDSRVAFIQSGQDHEAGPGPGRRSTGSLDSLQHSESPEGDHLAGLTCRIEGQRDGALFGMVLEEPLVVRIVGVHRV
jgi:hypothetical protein